jgi:hypothetical protein
MAVALRDRRYAMKTIHCRAVLGVARFGKPRQFPVMDRTDCTLAGTGGGNYV